MPKPSPGESRSAYISRCVKVVMGEGADQRVALAVGAPFVGLSRDAITLHGLGPFIPAQTRVRFNEVHEIEDFNV